MKCTSLLAFMAAASIALTGCDWGGTGSEESWNDSYSWANFSGTYKLVTNIEADIIVPTSDEPTDDSSKTSEPKVITKTGTAIHDLKPGRTEFSTGQGNLKPGTVLVTTSGVSWKDDGNGTLKASNVPAADGSVVYETGDCAVHYNAAPDMGMQITITYAYTGAEGGGAGGGEPSSGGGSGSGSSSVKNPSAPITWLNVSQKGNLLTMKDNDGTTYTGRITGASVPRTEDNGYAGAGHIRFPFEVTSTSNSRVTISGSLSGDWAGGIRGMLDNRVIDATYHTGKSATQFQAVSGGVTLISKAIVPADGTTE